MTDYELSNAVEIVRDRIYYIGVRAHPRPRSDCHFFTIDDTLVYWNFFLDFGPLNLGQTYRFCQMLNKKLKMKEHSGKRIYFYSSTHQHKRTNAAWLLSAYGMMYLKRTPEEAFAPFKNIQPAFPSFHDASPCVCTFNLSILDCLRGMYKAHQCGFFSYDDFDVNEYEYFEKVESGDLNWLFYGKFLAFAGPHEVRSMTAEGYHTLCPDDYIPYFKKKGVSLVVRLNKKYYNEKRFVKAGMDHLDLYYLDGSNPPKHILEKFIAACETTKGAIAVHCKAGLGRTGTCIGAYIMKHYKFTAEEIIGWLRVCRPGSIIGPQQHFMKDIQARMWAAGDKYRRAQQAASKATAARSSSSSGSSVGTGAGNGSARSRGKVSSGTRGSTKLAAAGRSRVSSGHSSSHSGTTRSRYGSGQGQSRASSGKALSSAARLRLSQPSPSSPVGSSVSRGSRASPLRAAMSPSSVHSDASQGDELRAARAGKRVSSRSRYGSSSSSRQYR